MRVTKSVFMLSLLLSSFVMSAEPSDTNEVESGPGGGEMYLGGYFGSAVPMGENTSDLDPRIGYGLHVGYCPQYHFGIGAYYLGSSGRIEDSVDDSAIQFYGLEGTYFLDEEGGLSAGLRAGLSHVSNRVLGNTVKINPFSYGVLLGYDYELKNAPVSLGIETNLMAVTASEDDVGGLKVKTGSFQVFNALFSFKLWI